MDKYPLVSIITPTYNHEKFIGQCIDSVLKQTYPNWEMIIIDDGSLDNTSDIVAQYKDKRISFIKQNNIGIWRLGETYNKALNISRGSLIAVLEGDDFWPPSKLEKQQSVFSQEDVVFSFGRATIVDSTGKILYDDNNSLKWFNGKRQIQILRRLVFENFVTACTVMCRKDALVSIGGFQQPSDTPFIDYPTWLKLVSVGSACPINEILGYWRRYKDQISFIKMFEMNEANQRIRLTFFENLSKEIKNSLSINISDLKKQNKENVSSYHLDLGRINLIRREWTAAQTNLQKAFSNSTPYTKIIALLGIICSYFKINLEWAAFIIRRPRYDWMLNGQNDRHKE
jgi:glycosyltransferase involved in cell wall biosynthesis